MAKEKEMTIAGADDVAAAGGSVLNHASDDHETNFGTDKGSDEDFTAAVQAAVQAALPAAVQAALPAAVQQELKNREKTDTKITQNTTEKKVEMVKIRITKTKERSDDVVVSVNGKRWQIKRGVDVEVPDYVAEVLENTRKMDELAMERMEEATKKFAQ